MAGLKRDLTDEFAIVKHATWSQTFIWKADAGEVIDFEGYSAEVHFRQKTESSDYYKRLRSVDGDIVLTPSETQLQIELKMSATATGALVFKKAVYDLRLNKGDVVIQFVYGDVDAIPMVTRV